MTKLPHELHDFTEREIESELVYAGRLLRVRRDRVALPDGHEAGR